MASVENDVCSEIVLRLIEGIRTLTEVDPVSTVMCVVTEIKVPISVFRVRICEPVKCRTGLDPCVRFKVG